MSRYLDLLSVARRGDVSTMLILPKYKEYRIPVAKKVVPAHVRIELLDIRLVARFEDTDTTVSYSTFGSYIGIDLAKQTLGEWFKKGDYFRKTALQLPDTAFYFTQNKNIAVETVGVQWLEEQKRRNISVSAKMIKDAAKLTYTVLQDWFEIEKGGIEVNPSFCVSWFDGFKKRHNITYCQLRGEAGSVDMDAIKPELDEITQICSEYRPNNIYNCDETGPYLKELNSKSYTVGGDNVGGKASRACRVSLLVCANASGTSIRKAETMSSLRLLVLGMDDGNTFFSLLPHIFICT